MSHNAFIMTRIVVLKGDITGQDIDAVVNAANKSLLGGGGVDGAIHRTAGPQLLEECRTLGGCETGEAKITKGYNLPAKYVIHTVGPVYGSENGEEAQLLANCYFNSLALAMNYDIKTIAFPAISTGIYGYPKEEASRIAIMAVKKFIHKDTLLDEVRFILFNNENLSIYQRKIE
jgi:O-acetyl-ADP-ribose deacetylase (regulator of RNase III)